MNTQDIKDAIERLPLFERKEIAAWAEAAAQSDYRVAEPAAAYNVEPEYSYMSVEDYLRQEMDGDWRHEYVNGVVYAMNGPTLRHTVIAGNLFSALHVSLRGGPCKAYVSNAKVRIEIDRKDIFYYPDVMVACTREGEEERYLRNPKLVVEVLSRSTQSTDRREKFFNYTQVASVEEYVLIAQDRHEMWIHRRENGWAQQCASGSDAIAEFKSLGFSLALAEIYRDVFR